jgi:hypothetical protein
MLHASRSVAVLAAALAKAQLELKNPEKSLLAKLPPERGQEERSFRYASLAAGLDIVRNTLGRYEIAIVQTTAMDHVSGTIKLTTTLAHASGEWISSEWPVCPIAELPIPRRMGAALTYARRYGLFTLVGIAGEDDLDAPDLTPQPATTPHSNISIEACTAVPDAPPVQPSLLNDRNHKPRAKPVAMLSRDSSARERDRLVSETAAISSLDDAVIWARTTLPIKNTLTREHASEVETAFERAMASFGDLVKNPPAEPATSSSKGASAISGGENSPAGQRPDVTAGVGPSLQRIPRRRDKAHLRFVASQPCLLCGRVPSDAHHLRFAQRKGLGIKVSDEFTVPLCRTHHRQLHQTGNEMQWWSQIDNKIDPLKIAHALWQQSRGHTSASHEIPSQQALLQSSGTEPHQDQ